MPSTLNIEYPVKIMCSPFNILWRFIQNRRDPNRNVYVGICDHENQDIGYIDAQIGRKYKLLDQTDEDWWMVEDLVTNSIGIIQSKYIVPHHDMMLVQWYYDVSRESAICMLMDISIPIGTFLIRPSKDPASPFALSVKAPQSQSNDFTVKHFKIRKDLNSGKYYIDFNHRFKTVTDLISTLTQTGVVLTAGFLKHSDPTNRLSLLAKAPFGFVTYN